MRILVTGGGGFLGTWIIKELLKNSSYIVTSFSRHNYAHLEDIGVPTIRGDLKKAEDVERAWKQGFDAVFHVASMVGTWGEKKDFDAINVEGTRLLLEIAQAQGCEALCIYGSPSCVFGRGGHAGADETLPYPASHLNDYATHQGPGRRAGAQGP